MNFLLALFIYSMILFTWGDHYTALSDMTMGMKFNEHAQEIGFCDGDILKSADGKELTRFNMDMIRSIVEAREVTVLRQGEEKKILLPELSLLWQKKTLCLWMCSIRMWSILYFRVVDSRKWVFRKETLWLPSMAKR